MAEKNQEIEAKFYVRALGPVEMRLQELLATLSQPRTHEYNLRFDTPERELTRSIRVLRLRKDNTNRMTYKGPGVMLAGIRHRQEIEFEVSDFENAQALLEALGYEVSMIYEKYRAVYDLGGTHVMLDEMPFGDFVEIEGPDSAQIQAVCRQLNLSWAARINDSYGALFEVAQHNLGISIPALTFVDFSSIAVSPTHLGVQLAG
jgi:adenylate cyclase, class 2